MVSKRLWTVPGAVFLALVVLAVSAGIASANWNIGDRIYGSNCNTAKDPVNVMFRGQGYLSNTLSEFATHLGDWTHTDGSTLNFWDHSACTSEDARKADNDAFSLSRRHIRFDDGDYDTTEEYWTAAAAHTDTLCLNGHQGVDFDYTRDYVRTAFINGGHYTELRQTFSSGSVYTVCGDLYWWEPWDGKVAWISHPGT